MFLCLFVSLDCNSAFSSQLLLSMHIKRVHDTKAERAKRPWKCQICLKAFKTIQYLRHRHMPTHSNSNSTESARNFKCTEIGKKFNKQLEKRVYEFLFFYF